METVGSRIKHVRELMGFTQEEFATYVGGITRGAVGNWERNKGIKTENILTVSIKTGADVEWLATGRGTPPDKERAELRRRTFQRRDRERTELEARAKLMPSLPILGEVAAGLWVDPEVAANERWNNRENERFVPPDPRFPIARQFAWIVKGRSLDRVAQEDDALVALQNESWIDIGSPGTEVSLGAKEGDLVIVKRRRRDGGLTEHSARRLRTTSRGQVELFTEYADPNMNTSIPLGDSEIDGIETTPLGVVVGLYRQYRRTS